MHITPPKKNLIICSLSQGLPIKKRQTFIHNCFSNLINTQPTIQHVWKQLGNYCYKTHISHVPFVLQILWPQRRHKNNGSCIFESRAILAHYLVQQAKMQKLRAPKLCKKTQLPKLREAKITGFTVSHLHCSCVVHHLYRIPCVNLSLELISG